MTQPGTVAEILVRGERCIRQVGSSTPTRTGTSGGSAAISAGLSPPTSSASRTSNGWRVTTSALGSDGVAVAAKGLGASITTFLEQTHILGVAIGWDTVRHGKPVTSHGASPGFDDMSDALGGVPGPPDRSCREGKVGSAFLLAFTLPKPAPNRKPAPLSVGTCELSGTGQLRGRDLARLEIGIQPAQPCDLGAPHPGGEHQEPERVQPVIADCNEELLRVLGRRDRHLGPHHPWSLANRAGFLPSSPQSTASPSALRRTVRALRRARSRLIF
jgi:hypothetical protein